jgi:CRP-like cAMP-binding protein
MTEMADKARTEALTGALRKVPAFADLSQDDLEWFIGHAEDRRAAPGEIVSKEDSPADLMLVLLEGEMRGRRESEADSQGYTVQAPAVTGYLPF